MPPYIARLVALSAAAIFSASAAAAGSVQYGSMAFHDELPGVLILSGEIVSGDSFELRRAMRDQEISVVVTASPGGNLYEGMQIASIINDKKLGTYLPEGSSCESACAIIFLGGNSRMVLGKLGVHQFYSGASDASASARKDHTAARTQYTTSEIIGIMNQFDTPPFVYEKMFSTSDIYYFKGSEKPELNRNGADPRFLDNLSKIDTFLEDNPIARETLTTERSQTVKGIPPATSGWPERSIPAPSESLPQLIVKTVKDIDFFGADLSAKGVRDISLGQCSDSCRSNSVCAAFSYVAAKRWCWLKSAVENVSYAPGVISGIYRWEHVTLGIFDRPFFEISANDLRGFDIFAKGLKNTTLEECRSICDNAEACIAFSWVISKNWCFPKYDVGPLVKKNGVISGVRKSQP